MSDERRQVLEMVASGKVTIEQADELLDVIAAKQPTEVRHDEAPDSGRQAWRGDRESIVATVAALARALDDEDADVRTEAARALGHLGQPNEAVLSALIKALHDEDADVRCEAARALGHMGQRTEHVLTALRDALEDGDADVRTETARALGTIGG